MLMRMRGIKVPGEISAIYFHTSDPLALERPLGITPLQAGFPAPTENCAPFNALWYPKLSLDELGRRFLG